MSTRSSSAHTRHKYIPRVEVLKKAVKFHTSCLMEDDRVVIGSTLTAIIRQRKHVLEKGRLANEEMTIDSVETVLDLRQEKVSSSVRWATEMKEKCTAKIVVASSK